MKHVLHKWKGLLIIGVSLAAMPAFGERLPSVFGRSVNNLFNFGGQFFNTGNFNLTLGLPQDQANFSRLAQPNIFRSNQEPDRRILIKDPRSGFVVREARLNDFGFLESRPTDAFGRPLFNFFQLGGLDTEAQRQAERFFLENEKLGDFNNIQQLFNGQVNFRDAFAANALAARSLGPGLTAGVVQIRCNKNDAYGRPTDLLAGVVNNTEAASAKEIDPAYLKMDWIDRCVKLMSYSLNHVIDPFHPPMNLTRDMVDPNTGILTVRNLRRHFNLRDLSIIFNRNDNTDLCNSDPFVANPIWSTEGVVRNVLDPKKYNLVKGWDKQDVNRNFFLTAGVNLAVPRQLLGRVGAPMTDHFFIDNFAKSGVATSDQSREIMAFNGGNVQFFGTFDTNSDKSGVQIAAQNNKQTGRNNQAYQQGEFYMVDQYGRTHWALSAAPNDKGEFALAEEAPASAAHAGKAVTTGQCIMCHTDGPAIFTKKGGPYNMVNINGTSGIQNLSANFSGARTKYQGFLQQTNSLVWSEKNPGSALPMPTDALKRANMPKTVAYVGGMLGYPPGVLEDLLRRDGRVAQGLGVDGDGNINSLLLEGGGKCLVKKTLGDPRRYWQAQAPAALASTTGQGPGQSH